MPRQARLDAPGVLHHIMVRGIERRKICICAVKKLFKINHENTKVRTVLKANAAKHERRHENQVAGDGFLLCGT